MVTTKRRRRKIEILETPTQGIPAIRSPWKTEQNRDRAAADVDAAFLQACTALNNLGHEVHVTCSQFKTFTEEEIRDLDMPLVHADVAKLLLGTAVGFLMDFVPGGEGLTKLGKSFWSIAKGAIEDVAKKPLDLLKGEVDKNKLRKAMLELATNGSALAYAWKSPVPGGTRHGATKYPLKEMRELVDRIQLNLKANSRKALELDGQQKQFLERFNDASVGARIAQLEYYYGIPSNETVEDVCRRLYQHLLYTFSRFYGYAASDEQGRRWFVQGLPDPRVRQQMAGFWNRGMAYWRRCRGAT